MEIRAPVAEIGKTPVNHVTVELKTNDFVGSSLDEYALVFISPSKEVLSFLAIPFSGFACILFRCNPYLPCGGSPRLSNPFLYAIQIAVFVKV